MLRSFHRALALVGVSLSLLLPSAVFAELDVSGEPTVSPVLTVTELKDLLDQPDVRVLDIRAPQDYAAGHIPGAVNTPYGAFRGPAENAGALRSEQELTDLLRQAGIDTSSHVVVAHAGSNQTDFGAAARVYWTLKVGGLQQLSVLDGGTLAWQAAGEALETATPAISPSKFSYRYQQEQLVDTEALAAAVKAGQAPLLLDARPEAFFKGEQRVDAAARYGTLPDAQVLEHASFFAADGKTLKSPDELRAMARDANVIDTPAVSFCNTGHWAATNWVVLSEVAGNSQVKLCPQSIVEWSKPDLPMDNQPARLKALAQDAKRSLKN